MENKSEEPGNQGGEKPKSKRKELPEVFIVRNWKEYFGESLLIIFSVALAIILTEMFSKMHENQQASQVLNQLRDELINNKEAEEIQYQYHLQVVRNIDSALRDSHFQDKIVDSDKFHLELLAKDGVMRKDLNDAAWQVAKQNNIISKINLKTYGLLVDIYNQQQRIIKTEDEIGRVLLSYESRKRENARTTLIIVRDNFSVWAINRAPRLLDLYKEAIAALSNY